MRNINSRKVVGVKSPNKSMGTWLMRKYWHKVFLACFFLMASVAAYANGGKLLGSSGVTSIEGAAGGGLVPWASLGAYATQDEITFGLVSSEVHVDDYDMSVHGVLVNFHDRVEVSFAHQDFYVDNLAQAVRQNVAGLKVRLFGDLIYNEYPLLSLGVQRKTLVDDAVINLVGAKRSQGTDFYLSAAKAWIDGLFHRISFVNANLRYSDANETGLLGYGGDDAKSKLLFESAAGLFVTQTLAIGAEFRQKRNHLSAIGEDNWYDVFVAWFPNKNVSVTGAYVELGEVVGMKDQNGFYFSLQAGF